MFGDTHGFTFDKHNDIYVTSVCVTLYVWGHSLCLRMAVDVSKRGLVDMRAGGRTDGQQYANIRID